MIVNTSSTDVTTELLDEYAPKYLNFYSNAMVRFKQLDFQFTKAPVEVRVIGDSINQIKEVGKEISAIFRKNKGVSYVSTDWETPRQIIRYNINRTEANRLGFTQTDLSAYLATSQKGYPVTTIWEEDYPVDVVLTKQKNGIQNDFEFNDLYVSSLFTSSVIPFRQIATATPDWSEGTIVRRNGVRTLTVEADIKRDALAADIIAKERAQIDALKLP